MIISYDPVKNKHNLNKHGVDLIAVEGVFYDDHAITIEDHAQAEERFITIGMDSLGRLFSCCLSLPE